MTRAPTPTSAPTSPPGPDVIHLVPALFGQKGVSGGAERYAFELARAMARRVRVRLVAFADADSQDQCGPLEVHALRPTRYIRGQKVNPWSGKLLHAIRQAPILHCHQQHIIASSFTAAAARLTGRKVFVSDLGGGGWDVSAFVSTDSWYHGHLHISEYSRRVFGHEHLATAQVILGGVDTERFAPASPAPARTKVLFVGRLLPHKGIDDLVRAMPSDLPLVVIGQPYDTGYYDHLRTLAKDRNVQFRTDCSDADIIEAYQSALCIALPSVYKAWNGQETRVPELLGQTLLEGMACGAPALATTVASLPEVVDHGISGFLVEPNNPPQLREAIERFRQDPDQALRMGLAARSRVLTKFTWDSVVERCLRIYGIKEPPSQSPQPG